jgi:hypothetical protein
MPNLIEGNFGRLGKGKTLRIAIKSYGAFCKGRDVASNLPVSFRHDKISSIEDFLNLSHCDILGDELWAIGDNRKRNALGELASIFCLRSRKQDVNIRYTQQFLQIDVRIAYITTLWINPQCYPYNKDPESTVQIPPEYIVCKRWNQELEPLPNEIIPNVKDYFVLYDTTKDPYFVKEMIDEKLIRKVKKQLEDRLTIDEQKEYEKLKKAKPIRLCEPT